MGTETPLLPDETPRGPTVATFAGNLVSLVKPIPESIDEDDLATQLARQPRFNGATRWAYSIAQHCWLASYWRPGGKAPLPRETALIALLHDAQEAYVGDLVRPAKSLMAGRFEAVEERLSRAIYQRFGFTLPLNQDSVVAVRAIDNALLAIEAEDLGIAESAGIRKPAPYDRLGCPVRRVIPWSVEAARDLWLERLAELRGAP